MTESTIPTLKSYLLDALSKEARGKRDFEVHILRSQPKRSHALFPWATDPTVKIYQEHTLVVLAERSGISSEQSAADRRISDFDTLTILIFG